MTTMGIRSTKAYAAWLERLAEFDRSTVAGMIDRACAQYAKVIGFGEEPPKRIP
jgi:hypothetical protein